MNQMQSANLWEELSDHHNMIDEETIEPDYFIDQAPLAHFIPNEKGHEKATQIFDGDNDLFDFENEVEPVLQVLVGKSIQHARIEAIEEYEAQMLKEHKISFLQRKEAELMETQRLEEARQRKNDEVDRRNLQTRTFKNNAISIDKKLTARLFAKDFFKNFKRETLKIMVDVGSLRRPVDFSVGSTYVPQLYGQIRHDMQTHGNNLANIDQMVHDCMTNSSKSHKAAIIREQNRRHEKAKAKEQARLEADEQKRIRKQKRAALREQQRLENLQDVILNQIVKQADMQDYRLSLNVYDVRNTVASSDGVIIIGGFVGELIMSLTAMLDFILANPQNQNFVYTEDLMEQFLIDLLGNESCEYPNGVCTINLHKSLEEIGEGSELNLSEIAEIF